MSSRIIRIAITRLAGGASLALLAAGCGSGSALVPSAPTTTNIPGVFGSPIPVSNGPDAISGVVAESGRSIAGANVNAWVDQGNFGYSYMYAHGALLTDRDGRYQMTGGGWCARLAPGL
jgi:hypothetical protein